MRDGHVRLLHIHWVDGNAEGQYGRSRREVVLCGTSATRAIGRNAMHVRAQTNAKQQCTANVIAIMYILKRVFYRTMSHQTYAAQLVVGCTSFT